MKIGILRQSLIPTTVGLIALLATSCGNQEQTEAGSPDETAGASSDEVVNVYSARHYNTDEQLYNGFKEKTGIQVNLIEGSTSELIERIKIEGDRSPADVLITVDAGRLWQAEQEDILQSVESSVLEEAIPSDLRHPEGKWFGLSQRARILVYNEEAVNPSELSTYRALADPQWQERLCVRSSNNIYNQSLIAAKIETMGPEATEQWVEGLVTNFAREPEGGDISQIKAVAEGVCDVAIANHYYLARLIQSDDPEDEAVTEKVAAFFPQPTHVNISGVGVVATAPHQENAVRFLEYLVSPEAQQFFAQGNNEYPVVDGIELDPVLQEFGEFTPESVNVVAYGSNNPEAVQIMDRAGWK